MRFTACGTTRGRTSPLTRKPQLHRSSAASSFASPVMMIVFRFPNTVAACRSQSLQYAHGDGELGRWLAAGVESHSYLVKRERSATRVDCFASLRSLKFESRKAAWRKRYLGEESRQKSEAKVPLDLQWPCVHISLARCKPTHGTKYTKTAHNKRTRRFLDNRVRVKERADFTD